MNMNVQLVITLAVLAFMAVSFMMRKISYGMTGMICMLVLAMTGIVDLPTAFSGFSNKTTSLVATMMMVAGTIGKTSLVSVIRGHMSTIQKKSGLLLLLAIFGFTILLTQLIGMTALMSVMVMLVVTLDDTTDLSQSRVFFLIAAINIAWFGRFPVGMGAALPLMQNAYYEGLVESNPEYLLTVFDYMKAGMIPSIVLTLYCLFAWKLIPKTKMDMDAMQQQGGREQASKMTKRQEQIIFVVFIIIMLAFIFSTQLGNLIYLLPIAGCIVLILTKVVSQQEASCILAGDMVFCVAGVLVVSSALSSSGAGQMIGDFVLRLLGSNPSSVMVITVFCVVTVVMTTFLSNNGTVAIMTPIAASTALAGGMNPKAVVLVVFLSSCLAIAFPTGCAASMMAYSIGNHNPVKLLRFTIPYLILGCISVIISASIFYPVYG